MVRRHSCALAEVQNAVPAELGRDLQAFQHEVQGVRVGGPLALVAGLKLCDQAAVGRAVGRGQQLGREMRDHLDACFFF